MDEGVEKKLARRARELEKLKKGMRDKVVRELSLRPEGREYLYWLLEIGHLGANPFANNALTTAFSCGELNVSQQILAHLIEVAPDGYLSMLKEKEEQRNVTSGTDGNGNSEFGESASGFNF